MSGERNIIMVLLLVLTICSTHMCGSLASSDNCIWQGKYDGKDAYVDINVLAKSGGYQASDRDFNYFVNICAPQSRSCDGYTPIALQEYKNQEALCYWFDKGTISQKMQPVQPEDPSKGFVLMGNAGETYVEFGVTYTRKAKFIFKCDQSVLSTKFDYNGASKVGQEEQHEFSFTSKEACVKFGSAPHYSSIDSKTVLILLIVQIVFLLLTPVPVILFFVIGAIVMKFKFQKTGLDIIPLYSFIKDIPFLVKDGVMLLVDLLTKVTGGSGYAKV